MIQFGHGLVFFLMGFAIWLQARRTTELTLGRSLQQLGLFGMLYAVASWGFAFIPIQRAFLGEDVVEFLEQVAVVLLALSFSMLLAFGLRLLHESGRWPRWCLGLAPGAFVAWGGVALLLAWQFGATWGLSQLARSSEVLARYGMAVPGAILAAAGLAAQREELRGLGMGHLTPHIDWLVFSFALYGLAAGVVGPPANFWPASVLHSDRFFSVFGIPIDVFRGTSGLLILYFAVHLLEIFDIEYARRLEAAEKMRAVFAERERIARELHDGIIQSLYAVGLHLEVIRQAVRDDPDAALQQIDEVLRRLNGAVMDIRRYILDLKAGAEQQRSLHEVLAELVHELEADYGEQGVTIELRAVPLPAEALRHEVVAHVAQVVREAINNAVRHGRARRVEVATAVREDRLRVTVQDNGSGFDPDEVEARAETGFGLKNIRQRARLVGGQAEVRSQPGRGTTVTLEVPLASSSPSAVAGGRRARRTTEV